MLDVRASRGAWLSVLAFVAGAFGTVLASPAPAVAATPLSWSIVNVDGTNALNGVSCPSKSLCVAVDGAGKVLTSTNPTGGRSAWSAPVTIDTTGVNRPSLNAVSCPSISLCVAVDENGNVLTSTGDKSAWSAPVKIGDGEPLTDVSCASSSLCVAVDLLGEVLTSTEPTGGASAWSTPTTLVGAGGPINYGVSCSPSAALCAVVGGRDLWTSINAGGSWSEPDQLDTPSELHEVGCSSSSLCVADDGDGNIFASTNPTVASAWTKLPLIGGYEHQMEGISCGGSFCAVLDSDGDVFTSTNPTGGASAWSATPIDDTENVALLDISCVSSSLCVASDNAGNVVVGFSLQPQTISLHVPAQSTVGSSALLSPTASSNLPVVLSLDKALTTNHACSVSGDAVSFAHAGSCVIDATQAGGSGYAAAAPVQATITVGPGPQTIKFVAPSHGTVGESVWLSPLASSGLAVVLKVDMSATTNNACSLSGSTVILAHAGSCVLDANQAGNADHTAAKQLQRTITVGQASQTIKVTAPSHGAVGGSAVLAPTASSGLAVVLSVDAASTTNGACSVSGDKVSFKAAGSCVIDANQAGDADYAAATQVKRVITVT